MAVILREMRCIYFVKAISLKMLTYRTMHMHTHAHTTRVSFQMGIKIHVGNAVGCVGVHGLTCTA